MKRTFEHTTVEIQNLQTKLCQHKSPDFQHAPSNPLYIRKNCQKRVWLAQKITFSNIFKLFKIYRCDGAKKPKISFEIKIFCIRTYRCTDVWEWRQYPIWSKLCGVKNSGQSLITLKDRRTTDRQRWLHRTLLNKMQSKIA